MAQAVPAAGIPPETTRRAGRSLASQAAVAVSLLLGFYVLAIGVLVAIVAVNVGVLIATDRIYFYLVIGSAAAVVAIVRGIFLVERGSAEVDGLRIDAQSQPELVGEVAAIADSLGTTPPDEIYLVHDVNAFVLERTRFLGLVRRGRVMAVGLALLNTLDVGQLRAVLAHEFGHYAGGETRLGGLVYRAQASIRETVIRLRDNWLSVVFMFYARLYWRVTSAVSRGQELAADAAAARVGGRRAAIGALREVHSSALAYDFFLSRYVSPAWHKGRYPDDVYSGFRSLLADPERQRQLSEARQSLEEEDHDPYDSHPALRDRVAFLESLPDVEEGADTRPARVLLRDPDGVERAMSAALARMATDSAAAEPIPWDAYPETVVAPCERDAGDVAIAIAASLRGQPDGTASDLLSVIEDGRARELAEAIVGPLDDVDPDQRDEVVRDVIGRHVTAAFAAALVDQGTGARWKLSWARSAQVVRAGRSVPVDTWVRDALESGDVAALRKKLSARRVDLGARRVAVADWTTPEFEQAQQAAPALRRWSLRWMLLWAGVGASALIAFGGIALMLAPDEPGDRTTGAIVAAVFLGIAAIGVHRLRKGRRTAT